MTTEIALPRIGFGMTEGKIGEWLVADGATVKAGQPIYTMENDKAIEEIEAPAGGVLRIRATPGETYPVGATVGVIE